jgi:GAF domain-containing protein/CheY-like chemotaxis protein
MSSIKIPQLVSIFEDITVRLAESQEPNRLYDVAVQIAMETTDAQACSLYLEQSVMEATQQPEHITMVAGAGFEKYRIGVAKYHKGEGLTGKIWQTSKCVKFETREQIEDPKNGWRGLHNKVVEDNVASWISYSLIGVPLKIGKRTIGVLKVENKKPGIPSYFSADDQVLLETIASTIALAIENKRSSEQSYSSILNALRDVSKMLVGPETVTFNTLCDSIVEKCIEVFNAEACSLYIEELRESGLDPEHIVMVSGAGYEKERTGAKYSKGQGLTGTIWKNSAPVKYDTRQEVEDRAHGWMGLHNEQVKEKVAGWECCSLIGVPLFIGDRTIGVLKVENKKPVKQTHFSYNELHSLEILASNIALALEIHRHREVVYERGTRARKFTHSIVNSVQDALAGVKEAIALLESPGTSSNTSNVDKNLRLAEKALLTIDGLRKSVIVHDPGQDKATLSVNHVLKRVIEHCLPALRRKNIELHETLLESDAFTNVNLEEMLTAFDNLIGNAIDALEGRQSPMIWIEAKLNLNSNGILDLATVILADNGSGLKDWQRQEFDSTRRISSTKHGGLGLGMSIANQCFADNSIYFRIISPPEYMSQTGAAFQIEIPLHEPRDLHVLFIDDDEIFLGLLENKVPSKGNVIFDTHTTYEILQKAIKGSEPELRALSAFDMIFLDCDFGHAQLDGTFLLKQLQSTNEELSSRVILMTGKRDDFPSRPDFTILDKYKQILETFPAVLYELRKKKG